MTKRFDEANEAARCEIAAYDVLTMLMGLNGPRPVLDVLRYWYVVTSLDGKRETAARPKPRGG